MAPSYRPSARQREAMDPATKRLAIFAGAIGTALLGLVAAWAFTGHHRTGVPVIEADSRPVKVKPANPGGMQIAGADEVAKRLSPRQAQENLSVLEQTQRLLHTNVQEALALEVGLLKLQL